MALKIEYKKIDDLIPYVNNARTHSEEQVAQIAASIREFGFTNPILLDGDNGIIAGHGRLKAAQKLKLKDVPTIQLEGLSENQKKAYILADNKLSLNAGWDDEILKIELEGVGELTDLVGFSPDELNLIFNGWQSTIEIPNETKVFDGKSQIRIIVDPEELEFARETITNALENAGITYEY